LPEGREEFLRYFKAAIQVPSPAVTFIESVASKHDIFLVVGVIERDNGTLYCTVLFFHPQRGLIGKHRKLIPTASERLIWGMGDASHLPVLSESFQCHRDQEASLDVKISAAICW
jgi:beta-cyano-L-alanine hydratase/nitrilase